MKKSEFIEKYGEEAYQRHLERHRQYSKGYYQEHKEEISEQYKRYWKGYYQDHKEERAEYKRYYYQNHRDEKAEYQRYYYQNHRDERAEYHRQYYSTPWGRASRIVSSNNWYDRNRGFDTSQNVSPQWVVDNVFSGQCCIYCGESDWTKLGCDRIDNTKPHTPDNIVPCCYSCNTSRGDRRTVQEQTEYINKKRNGDT